MENKLIELMNECDCYNNVNEMLLPFYDVTKKFEVHFNCNCN